jgi:hypothetical protein
LPKYGFQKLITKLLLQSIERARANRLHFEYGPELLLSLPETNCVSGSQHYEDNRVNRMFDYEGL